MHILGNNLSLRRVTVTTAAMTCALLAAACATQHQVETRSQVELAPVEVKPIHITIDINIKVDRELEDFFSDIDQAAAGAAKQGGTP